MPLHLARARSMTGWMDTNGREMEDGVEKNGGWMVVKDGHKDGNVGRTYSPEQIPDTSY